MTKSASVAPLLLALLLYLDWVIFGSALDTSVTLDSLLAVGCD